jgi:hypothetical protein
LLPSVHYHSPGSASAFPTAISLSSIIREIPQNYNNYIQAFREKDGIQLPIAYRHFFGKIGKVALCRS